MSLRSTLKSIRGAKVPSLRKIRGRTLHVNHSDSPFAGKIKNCLDIVKNEASDFFGKSWPSKGGSVLDQFFNSKRVFNQVIRDCDGDIFYLNQRFSKTLAIVFPLFVFVDENGGRRLGVMWSRFFEANGFEDVDLLSSVQFLIFLVCFMEIYIHDKKTINKGGKKNTTLKRGGKTRRVKKTKGGMRTGILFLFFIISSIFYTGYCATARVNRRAFFKDIAGDRQEARRYCLENEKKDSWWNRPWWGPSYESRIESCTNLAIGQLGIADNAAAEENTETKNSNISYNSILSSGLITGTVILWQIIQSRNNALNKDKFVKNMIERIENQLTRQEGILENAENDRYKYENDDEIANAKIETFETSIGEANAKIERLQAEMVKNAELYKMYQAVIASDAADADQKETAVKESREIDVIYKNKQERVAKLKQQIENDTYERSQEVRKLQATAPKLATVLKQIKGLVAMIEEKYKQIEEKERERLSISEQECAKMFELIMSGSAKLCAVIHSLAAVETAYNTAISRIQNKKQLRLDLLRSQDKLLELTEDSAGRTAFVRVAGTFVNGIASGAAVYFGQPQLVKPISLFFSGAQHFLENDPANAKKREREKINQDNIQAELKKRHELDANKYVQQDLNSPLWIQTFEGMSLEQQKYFNGIVEAEIKKKNEGQPQRLTEDEREYARRLTGQSAEQASNGGGIRTAPPLSESKPAAGVKTPSAAVKTPSAAVKTPSADEKTPSADEKTPSADEKTPSADEKTPSAAEKTPPLDDNKAKAVARAALAAKLKLNESKRR